MLRALLFYRSRLTLYVPQFSALFAFALAKPAPDVSEGYAYPTPASSYGVPLNSRLSGDNVAQVLPGSFSGSIPFAPAQAFQVPSAQVVSFAPVVSTTPSTVSVSYEEPSFASVVSSTPAPVLSSFNVGVQPYSGVQTVQTVGVQPYSGVQSVGVSAGFPAPVTVVSSGYPSVSGVSGSSFDSRFSSGFTSGSEFSGGFSSGGSSQFSSSATQTSSGATQVSKNLYFFSAPEEPEEPIRPRINVAQAPAQKNYKIIFIKTPEFRQQSVVNVPVASQNEEKTLVYVLVKRPEEGPTVNVQASSAVKPSKPEVYFIKYRTRQEAEEAISHAREGNFAGISANAVENSGFVESLSGSSGNGVETVTVSSPASGSSEFSSSFGGGAVESVSVGGGSSDSSFVSGGAAPLVSLNIGSTSTTPASFVAISESSTPTAEVPTVTTEDTDSGFVQNVVVSEERVNAPSSSGSSSSGSSSVNVGFVSSTQAPFSVYGPPAKRAARFF